MTIAIVINTAWNIYNFRSGIIKHLLKKGHRVVAIAPHDEYVNRLEALGCEFRDLPMSGSGINPVADLRLLLRMRRLLRSEKVDIVLTYTIKPNIYGSLVARSIGIPIVCNISGLGTTFIWKDLISRIAVLLYNLSVKKASHVFFQNPEDRDLFLSKVPIPTNRVGLLNGSGIDLNTFRADAKNPDDTPIFLMIGRLMKEKGAYEFAEAAMIVRAQYPQCRFWMIGKWDPDDKRYVKQDELAHWQENDQIIYKGTTDDIQSEIRQADVVVLPSYREGAPRTLLEAGAMSRPLIASDVPGCRHIVQHEFNGYLCEVKSGESLAAAMIRFIELPKEEKLRFAKNSRSFIADRYDEKLVIQAYDQIISELTFQTGNIRVVS